VKSEKGEKNMDFMSNEGNKKKTKHQK